MMRACSVVFVIFLALTATASAQTPQAGFVAVNPATAMPTLAPLVKKVTPSVVSIAVRGKIAQERNPLLNDPFFQKFFDIADALAEREVNAAGSGVIVDAGQGIIVTNNHFIEHAEEILVTLTDGRQFKAKHVGADPDTDIAIIRIAAGGLVAIASGDSDKLEVGDYVVAIGNPFGIGQTVTQGLVGATRRSGPSIRGYEDYIQTDAPINPGNSGGALVNLGGELVGINTAVGRPIGVNNGIGFAIPVNMIREGIDQLIKYGKLRGVRSLISAQDLTSDLALAMSLPENQPGAVIANVETGSAAERAGLKAGDVITAIDEIPVRSASDLRNKIELLRADAVAKLAVLRAGKSMVIRAALSTPTHKGMRGAQINPLLEGATLGSVPADSSMKGVELVFVQAGSRAARGGLRKGDVITAVNQEQIAEPDELATLSKARAKSLLLTVIRGGRTLLVILQ